MTSQLPSPQSTIPTIGDADLETRPPVEQRALKALGRHVKPRAQGGLRLVLGTIGWLTRSHAHFPPLRPGDPAIRRILVVRVDLLGDTVLSLPAVRALKRAYPNAEIDMLVQPAMAGILAGEGALLHEVIGYNPHAWRTPSEVVRPHTWRATRAAIKRLRAREYDLAISISGDIGSIVTRLSLARRRVGYAGEAYRFFLTDAVPGARYQTHQHEVAYVLDLARAAGGIVQPGDEVTRLAVLPEARPRVQALLDEARKETGARGPIVALHAGARNGQAKRWPLQHFATLAERLVRELDALVVLTGAPSEASLAAEVVRATCAPIVSLAGRTSLPELAALLEAADVVVSGDSGPMHIACAVGTLVVALHGPTDPALSGPPTPSAIVLREPLFCSPCYDASATAECRYGNPVCMKALAPSLAFAAVRRQLAGRVPEQTVRRMERG